MQLRTWLLVCLLLLSKTLFAEVVQINSQQLSKLLEAGVTMIDVRTPGEWKQTGIVEGSHTIMFFDERRQPRTQQWMQQISQLVTPEDELILICRTGNRSGLIANFLTKQYKFARVYNVQGGIKAWKAKGYQTIVVN